ncbi:hypothetical protein R6Q57_014416 [Mikania cordata]
MFPNRSHLDLKPVRFDILIFQTGFKPFKPVSTPPNQFQTGFIGLTSSFSQTGFDHELTKPDRFENRTADAVVVTVPFVAPSHLTQLLHIFNLISTYNITVHFITTTDCLRQLSSCHRTSTAGINFTIFLSHCSPHPFIPFPIHLQPSFDATLISGHPPATSYVHWEKTAGCSGREIDTKC